MEYDISIAEPVLHETERTTDEDRKSPLKNSHIPFDKDDLDGQQTGAAVAQAQHASVRSSILSVDDLCHLMGVLELHAQPFLVPLAQDQFSDGERGISAPDANSMDEEDLYLQRSGVPIAQGQDDALDVVGELSPQHLVHAGGQDKLELWTQDRPSENNNQSSEDMDDNRLQVTMLTLSTGITTFAYQRALRNRIRSDKLGRGRDYDTQAYTPTFVHDCLMLPGSLSNVLGKVVESLPGSYNQRWKADQNLKGSAEQIIHRMTPALLPGFHAYVHTDTEQPCLIQSEDPKDYVHGMLIFGEGREGRDQIHRHYRPHAKRIKVQVEFDLAVHVPAEDRAHPRERWVLRREKKWAHAWLWSNVRDFELQFRMDLRGWILEDYLAGVYAIHRALRLGCQQNEHYDVGESSEEEHGDDAYEDKPDQAVNEGETESPMVIDGGFKRLGYERSGDTFDHW